MIERRWWSSGGPSKVVTVTDKSNAGVLWLFLPVSLSDPTTSTQKCEQKLKHGCKIGSAPIRRRDGFVCIELVNLKTTMK
jgi:hypothetical protein